MPTEHEEPGELTISGRETSLPHGTKKDSFLSQAFLWFVWFPVSLILLVFVLERFILSEALL
jgi:hypothetical protein